MNYALAALDLAEHDAGVVEGYARNEAGVRRRGAIGIGLILTLGSRALFHARRGALLDAEADAQATLDTARPDHFPSLRAFPVIAMAMIQRERGKPECRLQDLDVHLGFGRALVIARSMLVLERARALHALGRPIDAIDTALALGAEFRTLDVDCPALQPWRQVAAEALLTLGDNARAVQLAADELVLAEQFGAPGPIGCAQRVLGLAERDLDRLQAAERTLAGSVRRLEHARALVDLGAALRRDGQRAAAREPLAAGMDIAHRCTATALVERAREELRASGARPRSVVRTGVESLTASELRAARLAAEGMTNRQIAQHLFVAQKTVETQLRAAYRKLDIAGRGELATALAA
jgi:DNA-binding CsgD family transcriptional regulator